MSSGTRHDMNPFSNTKKALFSSACILYYIVLYFIWKVGGGEEGGGEEGKIKIMFLDFQVNVWLPLHYNHA